MCLWSDWLRFYSILWNLPILKRSWIMESWLWCCRSCSNCRREFRIIFHFLSFQRVLTFRSAARYTKFRNLYYFDQVRLVQLESRESFDDPRRYFQPTLWVQCYVSSFYLLIFSTLLPAVRSRFSSLSNLPKSKPREDLSLNESL